MNQQLRSTAKSTDCDEAYSKLTSKDPQIRKDALYKILDMHCSDSFDIFVHFLHDYDIDVRGTAAFNLGELKDKRAIPYLVSAARNETEEIARGEMLAALSEYRDSEILDLLLTETTTPKRSRRPRQEVAKQLRYYDMPNSIAALISILEHDDDAYARYLAAESLELLNRSSLLQIWQAVLREESNPATIEIARRAIASL